MASNAEKRMIIMYDKVGIATRQQSCGGMHLTMLLLLFLCSSTSVFSQTDGFLTVVSVTTAGYTPPVIDCDSCDNWHEPQQYEILVPAFGSFLIGYSYQNCFEAGIYGIQINWVFSLNDNGADPFAGFTMVEALDSIAVSLLRANPMGFDPLSQEGSTCRKVYVHKASCWTRFNIGNTDCPVHYEPCDPGSCCLEVFDLCSGDADNVITKQVTASLQCCELYTVPVGGIACEPGCW